MIRSSREALGILVVLGVIFVAWAVAMAHTDVPSGTKVVVRVGQAEWLCTPYDKPRHHNNLSCRPLAEVVDFILHEGDPESDGQ